MQFGYVERGIVPSDICFPCVTMIDSFELLCAVLSFPSVLLFDCHKAVVFV